MPEKKTCFIIRPFSEPFNTRSEKIYKPAIIAAGLVPVEAGVPGDNKITDKIEEGIRNAAICLADLTLVMRDNKNCEHYEHNPNVWYELGFAFACHGQAVMVCNVDIYPMSSLPFDISHRFVNKYTNSVDSDELAQEGICGIITKDLQKKLKNAIPADQLTAVRTRKSLADKKNFAAAGDDNLNETDIKVLDKLVSYYLENEMISGIGLSPNTLLERINADIKREYERKNQPNPWLTVGSPLGTPERTLPPGIGGVFSDNRVNLYQIKNINLSLHILKGKGYVVSDGVGGYTPTDKAMQWYRNGDQK